jgi:ribose transport system permease protein
MFMKLRKFTVAILLVGLVVFFCVTAPGFASWNNLFNLLRQIAVLGITSCGMAALMILGKIDLSVGSVVSLVSCLVALMISKIGLSPILACGIGVVVAIAIMVLNGAIVLGTGIPAMLCTLATMQIFQGLTYIITNSTPIYGLPEGMRLLGQGYLWVIPIPVVIMFVLFIFSAIILSRTYLGRYFYAVGSNSEAARLSGIPITKTNLLAYALCGLMVGIAALVTMSRLGGGYPSAGSGLEMDAITAVVVGGVSFVGGKGKISGVFLGILLMGVLSNGLGVMGASTHMQLVFKGIVLIVVAGLDYLQQRRAENSKMLRFSARSQESVEKQDGQTSSPETAKKYRGTKGSE